MMSKVLFAGVVSLTALSGCCTPNSPPSRGPQPVASARAVPWLEAVEVRQGESAARALAGSVLAALIDLEAASVRSALPIHSGPDSFVAEEILAVLDAYPDAEPAPDLDRVPWVRARLTR